MSPRHLSCWLAVACVCVALPAAAQAPTLLASDQAGDLYRIDLTTAVATPLAAGVGAYGSTEIEADPTIPNILYMEGSDGSPNLDLIEGCFYRRVRSLAHAYGALNGLEFVGGTLYGTFITGADGPSDLVTVDTGTGALTLIGATGFGPISGLAYDAGTTTMYGVTAGAASASLVTVNLGTGAATLVAGIADAAGAPLDKIGGLEFGADGNLYGGTTLTASVWPGSLIRINTTTAVATLVGSSGVSITGLTPEIECASFTIPTANRWGLAVFIVVLAGAAVWLIGRRVV